MDRFRTRSDFKGCSIRRHGCSGRERQSSLPLMGKSLVVAGTAKDIAGALPEDVWRRLSAGDGTKGARLHDWAYLELADL